MSLSDADLQRAERRMQARLKDHVRAAAARFDPDERRIVITLMNGLEVAAPVELIEGLAGARPVDLSEIVITPTGLGLHWPRLDADVYLPAMLEGVFGSRRWMAHLLGKAGGQAKSPAKAAAARANGMRGGRPRKQP